MSKNIELQIIKSIRKLSIVQQLKLLDFVNSMLELTKNKSNEKSILQFAGEFEEKDLDEMKIAIEDCEQIDKDEW